MRLFTLLMVAVGATVATLGGDPRAGADDLADDLRNLDGQWVATGGTWKGKDLTKDQVAQCKVNFLKTLASTQLTLTVAEGLVGQKETKTSWEDYTITLDTKATPKILWATKEVGFMSFGLGGIYEIKDDQLTVCLNLAPLNRKPPKEFKTTKDSEHLFLTLQRKR